MQQHDRHAGGATDAATAWHFAAALQLHRRPVRRRQLGLRHQVLLGRRRGVLPVRRPVDVEAQRQVPRQAGLPGRGRRRAAQLPSTASCARCTSPAPSPSTSPRSASRSACPGSAIRSEIDTIRARNSDCTDDLILSRRHPQGEGRSWLKASGWQGGSASARSGTGATSCGSAPRTQPANITGNMTLKGELTNAFGVAPVSKATPIEPPSASPTSSASASASARCPSSSCACSATSPTGRSWTSVCPRRQHRGSQVRLRRRRHGPHQARGVRRRG